jgi:hypothetical protein
MPVAIEGVKHGECRRCSECDGEHHFSDAMRTDDGDFQCKHCDATTIECDECGEAVPYFEKLDGYTVCGECR